MANRKSVSVGRVCAAICITMTLAAGPAAAKPQRYELDPAHTQVLFSVERFGFTKILGWFQKVDGTVQLDEKDPANSSVAAVISTGSLASGNEKRDQALNGKFWLNTGAHPEIRFESTSVEQTGPKSAKVIGNLTIKGVSKSVTLDVTLNKLGQDPATQKHAAGFTASTRISRAAFGMETAPELIGDEVSIEIQALAYRSED